MGRLILGWLFGLLMIVPLTAKAAGTPALFDPEFSTVTVEPPAAIGPIRVSVGIYILNLVALDEVEQTFTCTGYLTETWRDTRLAFNPKPGGNEPRYYQKSAIWFPLIQFDNSASPRTLSSYLLSGSADGTITYTEKFAVRLSSNMKLRAFPFDSQELEIVLHPFTNQEGGILLSVDPSSTGISTASYTPLPLWHTDTVTYGTATGNPEAGETARRHVTFKIGVVRNSEYYIYRIFLPLALMVAVSWGVLWVPPNDLNSQLLISVTTILTLVVFSVALSNILPPVAYLTFYDIFFLVSFFFILLAIGEPLIIHEIYNANGREAASRARRLSRFLLPILFPTVIATLACIFLG